MGNTLSQCVFCNEKKNKNENNNPNEYLIISGRYCFKCNQSFQTRIDYHNHVNYCEPRLRGDL
jgi:hypothetical protein